MSGRTLAAKIKLPKFEKAPKQRYVIRPEEFKKILERFPEDSNFYLPLMIGYYTGLRLSEAFALCWDDIDMEQPHLIRKKDGRETELWSGCPKSAGTERERKKKSLPGTLEHRKQSIPSAPSNLEMPSIKH